MSAEMTPSEQLFECFQDALKELIAAYAGAEPTLEHRVDCATQASLTAIVGLSSSEISASVAIITSEDSVLALAETDDAEAADWLGELGNQLAGRLKNKIQRYGLKPSLSTPTTVRGQFLHVTSTAAESFEVTVRFLGGQAVAQLTLNIDPEITLERQTEPCSAAEGSLELF